MTAVRAVLWHWSSQAMVGGVQIRAFASPAHIPSLQDSQTECEEQSGEQEHWEPEGEPCIGGHVIGCHSRLLEGVHYLR